MLPSEGKINVNKMNAQLSTGPKDTTSSRFNALTHGILAKEALISTGDGREDAEAFHELANSLHRDLAPDGSLEELLVDQLVMLTWRWRRILRYETAAIRQHSDTAVQDWERQQREISLFSTAIIPETWQSSNDLAARAELLKEVLKALETQDPLAALPNIWLYVFDMAAEHFKLPIRKILALNKPWNECDGFTRNEIGQVIDAACQKAKISEEEFWKKVETKVRQRYEEAASKWERRSWALERQPLLLNSAADFSLVKVQRYEAHLSRQFYKALHELQRLQVARLSSSPSAPIAVDIHADVST